MSEAGMIEPVKVTGSSTITYSFTDTNDCTNTAMQTITVNQPPTVTLAQIGRASGREGAKISVDDVSLKRETFSGTGVTAAGIFDPSKVTGSSKITDSF